MFVRFINLEQVSCSSSKLCLNFICFPAESQLSKYTRQKGGISVAWQPVTHLASEAVACGVQRTSS